jgi:DNA invertase Pin-like site-specific DNA recombinase
MKVIIYSRTSTKKQNISEQTGSIIKFCNQSEWVILRSFKDEGKSGHDSDRNGLMTLFDFIENNNVDKIVVTELSRLSRCKEILKDLILKTSKLNVSIFLMDLNLETLINCKLDTNILTVLYDELNFINIESEKIRNRISRGYNSYRSNGGKVGRKVGFRNTEAELLLKHEDIVNTLIKGLSVRATMMVCDKSSGVVQKIKKILESNGTLVKGRKTISTNSLLKKMLGEPSGRDILDL